MVTAKALKTNEFATHVEQGDATAVESFLNAGMNPNAKNNDGWTVLMIAAKEGHTKIVQALLDVRLQTLRDTLVSELD